ncbi:chloride channel protein [Methylobacterium marchantiae]|uniref:Chloride channel protein n=1 Tax=Methylobacterium marchantiae TaxID=600331 RepID=A0ABW3WZ52_9HYPH|nr:H(+)/Cl(-) exchange transporter ClcA [Methylobacterium marchantiae]
MLEPEPASPPARTRLSRLRGAAFDAAPLWRQRLLFLFGGLCVGLAAVAMAKLADWAQDVFRWMVSPSPLVALVLTPLGFAIAILLSIRVFPNSQGSGIPQVIAARHTEDPAIRSALVSLRTAFGKILVMTFGLACGASTGREGPTVQVGAAIMAAVGRLDADRLPGVILAGGAAGVAAAFNTPIAGIVFGIEELSRTYEARTSGLIVATVIAAGLTALAIQGDYTYFGTTKALLPFGPGWLAVPILGVLGGVAGGVFGRVTILFARGLPGRIGGAIRRHPVVFGTLCGLGVALCGLASGGTVYGTGYEEARAMLHGTDTGHPAYAPLKFLATVFSSISGIPGGLFAPSLSVGAGMGVWLHGLFAEVPIGALVLIGMTAYLTGALQAPITAFVIVTEMTQDHSMMIPLMVTALIADAVSKLICREGLYHALAAIILEKADPGSAPVIRTA